MLEHIKNTPLLKWVLGSLLALSLILLIFYFSIYFGAFGTIPSSGELSQLRQHEATEVLSADGKLIGKYYVFDRQPIKFEQIPQHLTDALLATEDVRFYKHDGVDGRSLLRVFFKTLLLQDRSSGGGSTITLQLAKNLYGRQNHGYLGIVVNKFQETIIARRLEDIYSKKEILTLYLNTVPFSDNTFGIESAAMKFFGKRTPELRLEESAVLVGMLKASHYYNPRIFPERSKLRRDVVLHQMVKYGYLNPDSLQSAKNKEIILEYQSFSHDEGLAPYFREQLRKDVIAILDTLPNKNGEPYNIYRDGLIIHTTLDHQMQQLAEDAVLTHMAALQQTHEKAYGNNAPWLKNKEIILDAAKRTDRYGRFKESGLSDEEILSRMDENKRKMNLFNYGEDDVVEASTLDSIKHYTKFLNAGFIAVEPQTGAVKTWVGGIDFENFKYDHVKQSKRQVGSTFKPIVYTSALENGIEPCTYFSIGEVTYEGGWTPRNSGPPHEDPYMNYPLQTALSQSYNTIAVKVLMETGIMNVINQANRMGITSELPRVPSLALGTAELNVAEVAKAYTSYVNGGKPSTPYYITRIEDGDGNILAEFQPEIATRRAFTETNRLLMLEMMKSTINEGTAVRLRTTYGLQNDIAGKTGTTQANKDGWFVGIMPKLVTVTWVGADDHRIGFRTTSIGQGANSALPVFALFLKSLNEDDRYNEITQARFTQPSETIIAMLDCEPEERDGFFKRLFSGNDRDERRPERKQEKEKKGFFQRLFGKKDNN